MEASTGEYISLRRQLEQLIMMNVEGSAGRCTGPKGRKKYSPHGGEKLKSKISWDTAAEGTDDGTQTFCVRPENFPSQAHMVRVETDVGTLCGVIKLTTGSASGVKALSSRPPRPGYLVEAWASLWRHGFEFNTSRPKFVNGKLWAKKQKAVKVNKDSKDSKRLPCDPHKETFARMDGGIRKALARVAMSAGTECLRQFSGGKA